MQPITITLSEQYEKLNPDNPLNVNPPPLYHQQRTCEALQENELVINSYNTGTGKTKAALFHLFDLKGENVLFIAPTNELIRQHVEDIQKFVEQYSDRLDFHVLEVNAEKLRELDAGDDFEQRNPKKLHELIQNPLKYFPEMEHKKPIILVTNPDIFYLCFYFAYSRLDERNLFADFLKGFDYIIVDEFSMANVDFSEEFNTAIEQKQVAEQAALQKQYELQSAEKDVEITLARAAGEKKAAVIAAEGRAEARKLEAQAEAEALRLIAEELEGNPALITYQWATQLSPSITTVLLPADQAIILDAKSLVGK